MVTLREEAKKPQAQALAIEGPFPRPSKRRFFRKAVGRPLKGDKEKPQGRPGGRAGREASTAKRQKEGQETWGEPERMPEGLTWLEPGTRPGGLGRARKKARAVLLGVPKRSSALLKIIAEFM